MSVSERLSDKMVGRKKAKKGDQTVGIRQILFKLSGKMQILTFLTKKKKKKNENFDEMSEQVAILWEIVENYLWIHKKRSLGENKSNLKRD